MRDRASDHIGNAQKVAPRQLNGTAKKRVWLLVDDLTFLAQNSLQ